MSRLDAIGPRTRVVLMATLFCVLCAMGIAFVLHRYQTDATDFTSLLQMPTHIIALIIALSLGTIGAEVLRFWVVGRAVEVPISLRTAWDGTIANFFFAWITPGAALSEPATIYMFTRHNVPVDAATVLTFTKTITGTTVFMGTAFTIMALGFGPSLPWVLYLPFVSGTGVFFAVAAFMWMGSKHPDATVRWLAMWCERGLNAWPKRWPSAHEKLQSWSISLIDHTRDGVMRLQAIRRRGVRPMFGVFWAHALYYGCFVGVLLVLASQFEVSSMWRMGALSIVYQVFIYVAPTPGGAGLSEASAQVFFGDVLRAQDAVVAVLLFRALTFYTHILIGLAYLPWMSGILSILKKKKTTPTSLR